MAANSNLTYQQLASGQLPYSTFLSDVGIQGPAQVSALANAGAAGGMDNTGYEDQNTTFTFTDDGTKLTGGLGVDPTTGLATGGFQDPNNAALAQTVVDENGKAVLQNSPWQTGNEWGEFFDALALPAAFLGAGVADAAIGGADAGAAATAAPAVASTAAPDLTAGIVDTSVGTGAAGVGASALGAAPDLTAGIVDTSPLSYLPATTGGSSLATLDPGVASSLGIDTTGDAGLTPTLTSPYGSAGIPAPALTDPTAGMDPASIALGGNFSPTGGGGAGIADSISNFLSSPKNDLSLGLGAMSLLEGLSKPKLPSAASQILGSSTTANAQAQNIISSGGYSAPGWATQKAAIDAEIAQAQQQAIEQLQQNAANTGQAGGIVTQQIAQLKQNFITQQQQLYAAALQQNVNNAVQELTGSNQALTAIAQLQSQQTAESGQIAAQTAALAAKLASMG